MVSVACKQGKDRLKTAINFLNKNPYFRTAFPIPGKGVLFLKDPYTSLMATIQNATEVRPVFTAPRRMRTWLSAALYLAKKALSILLTIFFGVFLTLLIVNYPSGREEASVQSPFQTRLEMQIADIVEEGIYKGTIHLEPNGEPNPQEVAALQGKLRSEAGLDLPFLPRYLLWTLKALRFDWGNLNTAFVQQLSAGQESVGTGGNIVLQTLPNTLLLVGTAYLIVFLLGMPFSLYLARHYGGWLDRTMAMLSPISSVPSWVFAMLLVTIFAVQLRWLPVTGMFGFHKPTQPIPYVLTLIRHMILPVAALVLSLLFQLIYTWRTFLVIYSEEDYVDLARAKGLETRLLEKQYILRPALPYIITSFTTSLIFFWQLTVVLERVFQWPGIGLLYIQALPNFWGENVAYGDLMVVVQIVVTFAYMLGILVFLMDIAYVIVDPRIHLVPKSSTTTNTKVRGKGIKGTGVISWMMETTAVRGQPVHRRPVKRRRFSTRELFNRTTEFLQDARAQLRLFAHQLRLYPSAIFGLVMIALLLAGSLYALLALPYAQIGREYDQLRATGRNTAPRTAAPLWTNLFSVPPRLSTLILDENSREAKTSTRTLENGWTEKTMTFQFDYPHREIPSDMFLYFDTTYSEKFPFVSMEWVTPDGRMINLKSRGIEGDRSYDLNADLPARRLLLENPIWKKWFVTEGQYTTPPYYLLFAKPGSDKPEPLHGTYQLKLTTLLFEKDSDLKPQLVVLGQVYGLAGTDYWRRDLMVPLFWAMPIALLVGFVGMLITTLIAMLLPAVGVWFGGWLDNAIQRVAEINMVLPGLAIAVLINALYGVHIWIILGIVAVLIALGAPVKNFRSALLQAKEAPYIEMARSYGASDSRIIFRYLVPRILPVLIPFLVMQIPTFIFLEATLGMFNIKSTYPSWGRIIYDALAKGALYGSPFWVLEPIFLLLLTGLAFAMLGSALERILNPRIIETAPTNPEKM
jgi:peptide/nickel transport system permease protein